jgi:uncharacterized protein
MSIEVEIRKFKDMNLKGGTIIEGFPSVGLASTIASNYLIGTLDLDQICALESNYFPPISMIYAKKPKFPARVYASEKHKLAVFLSEFTPLPNLSRPLAMELLKWAKEQGCIRIISPEGLRIEGVLKEEKEPRVWGVGSTDEAREQLKKCGIEQLEAGMIAGVAGVLLNEGRWRSFDIISLLVEARPNIPDARAAAKLIEAIDKLLPDVKIEIKPLYEKAGNIEGHLKKLREQAEPAMQEPLPGMYG